MLRKILEKINSNSKFINLSNKIENNENCSCFGLNFSEISLFLGSINRPIIFVVNNLKEAYKYQKQFESLNKKTSIIVNKIENYYYNEFNIDENLSAYLNAMFNLSLNKIDILIVLSNVLMQKLISPKTFKENILSFTKNSSYNFSQTVNMLSKLNYVRVNSVEKSGEFSVSGDIINIFPISERFPIRLDFFDDLLENISYFNVETYAKINDVNEIKICPNTLIFYNENDANFAILYLKSEKEKLESVEAKNKVEYILNDIENRKINLKTCYFLPFIQDNNYNILNYLSADGLVVFAEPKLILDNINSSYVNFFNEVNSLQISGELSYKHKETLIEKNKIFSDLHTKLAFLNLNTSNRIFESKNVFSFLSSFSKSYNKNFNLLRDDIKLYLKRNYRLIFCIKNDNLAVNFQNFLKENSIFAKIITSVNQIEDESCYILISKLMHGAIFPEDNFVILGNFEIYGSLEVDNVDKANKTRIFTLPKIGDYVVHAVHGICKCLNIEKITFNGFTKDYIVLLFLGGDKLYLPTEKADQLSAYIGTSDPKLNKMGGAEFEKEKQKVKSKLKEMAFDLLKLYAEREKNKGFKFVEDDYVQLEFENAFPYELTTDQQKAILDIKKDMTSGKIMDRLVCGDVGYGKTEVALVAAFKAILSGKQVAFLSPTTILSEQHYKTCLARMSAFMVNVACLNRFKTKSMQKEILKDLQEGKINIICGTHRLLSSDVKFKDLGLLILDEEQRFGVEDKEKIKNLKKDISVITLSATPIPRTLHLSMIGVRDISVINTPPKNRIPVQTIVVEYSQTIIKEAILRELNRNGQVLIIYNRVENIYNFANSIRTLFPDVNIGVAHGQMPQNMLENEIQKLYNEETKILISTVLIENGIDLPSANTLIVVNADKLGLSQLYQLRGRVGRSDKNAYAYFTFESNMSLKEESYKRLSALTEFSELGSGFKIAMRDLEIRGAGTVFGKAQHGHIEKVGYDMYVKLLKESVNELKGNSNKKFVDTKIEVSLNCFIPQNFIDDENKRLYIYEKIASLKNIKEKDELINYLIKNYNSCPKVVENLIEVALLKNILSEFNAKRLVVNANSCFIEFSSKEDINNPRINEILLQFNNILVLKFNNMPIIECKFNDMGVFDKLEKLIKIFNR